MSLADICMYFINHISGYIYIYIYIAANVINKLQIHLKVLLNY